MKTPSYFWPMMCIVLIVTYMINLSSCLAQTTPVIGRHENTPNVVVFTNARIITAPGQVIENATFVVRDKHIEAVGKNIDIPTDAVVRDVKGATIYPGFIDLYTHYGIPDVQQEQSESGFFYWHNSVRPEIDAAKLFRSDEDAGKKLRKSGVTAVVTFPKNGILRGSGTLVLVTDTDPNEAVLKNNVAQSLAFTSPRRRGNPNTLMGHIALIRQTFLDADWYKRAWEAYDSAPAGRNAPETNLSLAALEPCATGVIPAVIETTDGLDIFRATNIASELGLNLWVCGCGYEYRYLDAVKNTGAKVILPVNFPATPDVSTDEISLRELRHWDFAPENPARLSHAGIGFSLTGASLKEDDIFLKNVRIAVKRGLSTDKALAALTTIPAEWLNMSKLLGTLEKGKIANFIITDGDLFEDKTEILDVWVAGRRYEINPVPKVDVRGTWAVEITPENRIDAFDLEISGKAVKPEGKVLYEGKTVRILKLTLGKRMIMCAFPTDSLGFKGIARMTGMVEKKGIFGHGTLGDGARFNWQAELTKPWEEKLDTTEVKPVEMAEFPIVYPEGAFGRTALPEQPETVMVKNAVIWTCGSEGMIENADLLIKKGKIARVGRNIKIPQGAVIIDGAGKHITPGLIDDHSHVTDFRGVDERMTALSSDCRISDLMNGDRINIYRQLAGGVTMACVLYGSDNPIGGLNEVMKFRWGALPKDMIYGEAKPSIKFGLGENPKQSNISGPPTTRYPRTRMGVEQFIRDSFEAAKDYRREWQEYEQDKNLMPPRRNLRLEPLLEVLDDKRQVQCHAYRQDEILALIRLADEIGFRVELFIHNLEGYKVADVMKKHGAMATIFSDWWAYKIELYDAIPYNGAILHDQGVVVSVNSDNAELGRRMNLEAAKAVKYGNVPPEEALKFVTLNPAIHLHIDDKIGSLEKGKDADFVIWSGNPLSAYSKCEQTWIDGRCYFDIVEDKKLREKAQKQRVALIQKVLKNDGKK